MEARRALFIRTTLRRRFRLPARLGCALTEAERIWTDERDRTSVAGVSAAGDAESRVTPVVAAAAASGVAAATMLTDDLVAEENVAVAA